VLHGWSPRETSQRGVWENRPAAEYYESLFIVYMDEQKKSVWCSALANCKPNLTRVFVTRASTSSSYAVYGLHPVFSLVPVASDTARPTSQYRSRCGHIPPPTDVLHGWSPCETNQCNISFSSFFLSFSKTIKNRKF
jgi:hypothetical protein